MIVSVKTNQWNKIFLKKAIKVFSIYIDEHDILNCLNYHIIKKKYIIYG